MQIRLVNRQICAEGLGVPYPKGEAASSENIGYHDVKRFPEDVTLFPELQKWPELQDLILVANQPDSIFRTLRCDISSNQVRSVGARCEHKISSYITLAFELLDLNTDENFKKLYGEFQSYVAPLRIQSDCSIEFELVPTSYHSTEHVAYTAWSVDLWIHGYGPTEKGAKTSWLAGMLAVKGFVRAQSNRYRNILNMDRKKIGDFLVKTQLSRE